MKPHWQILAADLLKRAADGERLRGDWKWPDDWTAEQRLEFARAFMEDNDSSGIELTAIEEREIVRLAGSEYLLDVGIVANFLAGVLAWETT